MSAFRKAISYVVLVSYTKLVLASSFAQDSQWMLNGQHPEHYTIQLRHILPEAGDETLSLKVTGTWDQPSQRQPIISTSFTFIADSQQIVHNVSLPGIGQFTLLQNGEVQFKGHLSSSSQTATSSAIKSLNIYAPAVRILAPLTAGIVNIQQSALGRADSYLSLEKNVSLNGKKIQIETDHIDNQGGNIKSQEEVSLKIGKSLKNKSGFIESSKSVRLTFSSSPLIDYLGSINGALVYFDTASTDTDAIVKNGRIISANSIFINSQLFTTANVIFQTPCLYLNVANFQLEPQNLCERTIVKRFKGQNFKLTSPYTTAGTFEIWQAGFKSSQDVHEAITERFEESVEPLPAAEHTLEIQNTIKADQGVKVYAPAATLRIGDVSQELIPEILLPHASLAVFVSLFDLEQGTVATKNAVVYAPLGIKIGRLIKDPTREVFSTAYAHSQCNSSHNLGGDIAGVKYKCLGQEITNVYRAGHLFVLPAAIPNPSVFLAQEILCFNGPLHHQGRLLEAQNFVLNSAKDSICEASETNIKGDFLLKGKGNLHLKPHIGELNFTYYTYGGCRIAHPNQIYRFTSSEGAKLNVLGALRADPEITLYNQASTLHAHQKAPDVKIDSQDFKASLYQKFMEGTPEQNSALYNGRYNILANLDRVLANVAKGVKLAFANNPIAWNGCEEQVCFFQDKTNDFAGAQIVFPALTSFDDGVVLPADNTKLQGYLSAPLMLIPVGDGGLALGSVNPFYIEKKSPIRDLTAKPFNTQTTTVLDTSSLVKEQAKTSVPFTPYFKFSERFWEKTEQSQEFYHSIHQHMVVLSPKGAVKKPEGATICSLSSGLLVKRVREECQEALMRGYIYENRPIDEAQVKELHYNATEYLRENNLDPEALSHALMLLDQAKIPLPAKPIIYYLSFINERGAEELKPMLFIPPQMLDEARGQRGGKVRTHLLGIIPAGLSPQQTIEYFQKNNSLQQDLLKFFEQNPQVRRHLNQRAINARNAGTAQQPQIKQDQATPARPSSQPANPQLQKSLKPAPSNSSPGVQLKQAVKPIIKAEPSKTPQALSQPAPFEHYRTYQADFGNVVLNPAQGLYASYTIYPTLGDGNCFFHAAFTQADQDTHQLTAFANRIRRGFPALIRTNPTYRAMLRPEVLAGIKQAFIRHEQSWNGTGRMPKPQQPSHISAAVWNKLYDNYLYQQDREAAVRQAKDTLSQSSYGKSFAELNSQQKATIDNKVQIPFRFRATERYNDAALLATIDDSAVINYAQIYTSPTTYIEIPSGRTEKNSSAHIIALSQDIRINCFLFNSNTGRLTYNGFVGQETSSKIANIVYNGSHYCSLVNETEESQQRINGVLQAAHNYKRGAWASNGQSSPVTSTGTTQTTKASAPPQPRKVVRFSTPAESSRAEVLKSNTPSAQAPVISAQSSRPLPTLPQGKVTISGEVKVGNIGVIAPDTLTINGEINAKHNALLASLFGDVHIQSKKERIGTGDIENYLEHIPARARIKANEIIHILASQGNVIFEAGQTHSGLETNIEALGKILDIPVVTIRQHVQRFHGRRCQGMIRTTTFTPHVSSHQSEGAINLKSGQGISLHGPQIKAGPKLSVYSHGDIEINDVQHVSEHQAELNTKRRGFGGTKKSAHQLYSSTTVSQGAQLEAEQVEMASVSGNVKLVNPTINGTKASVTAPQGTVRFNAGVNHKLLASNTTKKSPMWQSAKQHKEERKTYAYPSLNCPVEVTSQETIAQVVQGKPALYLDQITLNGGKLTQEALQEVHQVHIKKVKGPGQALGALVALAMTILTYGAGAGFAAGGFAGSIGFAKGTALCAMVNAGAASLSGQLVNGMLSHSGNLGKAIKGVNTKALLISVASAGITHGLSTEFDIAKPDMLTIESLSNSEIFMQHLQYNLMQSGVSATLSMVVNGEAPKDALVNGLKSVVANTVGGFMANQIGSLYNEGSLDYVTHKLTHSLVGGLMGAIICDKPEQGALAGAIGAFAAEVVAEAVAGDTQSLTDRIARKARAEGRILSQEEFTKQFQAGLMESAQWGKLSAALATLIAHQDVNIGIQTGANAVENNFLIFAYYAAVAAGVLYSGYKIAEVLDKEGPWAALEQLGIEIAINTVGGAAFRAGAPVVFRFAGKVYTSVKEVVNAALSYTPGLKTVLGSTLEQLIVAAEKMISSYAEKYAASSVGKKIAELESKLIQTEAKVVNNAKQVFNRGKTDPLSSAQAKSSPKNVANQERYKANLGKEMEKPHVENPELELILNDLYRENAKIGSGSTAAALRYERLTGEKVGGKLHEQKVLDSINRLEKWLDNNLKQVDPKAINPGYKGKVEPNSSIFPKPGDIAAAENVLKDLKDAYRK